jgi:EAL domain-containing protein (putative c-di-GMP-specific phosphodiesterase class I)/GGDEF domain-containing protein
MDSDANTEIAAHLLAFAEQTKDFVGVTDPWGRVLYLNPAARKRLGLAEDAADLTTADLFPEEAFAIYYDLARPELLRSGAWTGEYPVKIAGDDRATMRVSITARLGPGGEINECVLYGHEIAPADAAAGDVDDVDETTGLLRRSAFDERARRVLAAATRSGESCALVLATIGDAGTEHEAFPALTAQTVMRALAGRMIRFARTIDGAGRFGESQLGLLVRGVSTQSEALRIGRLLHASLIDPPVTTPGEEIAPSVRFGVGFAPPGTDLSDLIEAASAITWNEPATIESQPVMSPAGSERIDAVTLDEFRIAMSQGDVRPYAQPVIDMVSGVVVGYQGLARWHHRRMGPLDAASFTDMIAETTLANQLDLFIARETAAVLTLRTRDAPLSLYVPASRRLVADVRTEQYLSEIVDAFSLGMHQVHLQLAPDLVADAASPLRDALAALRDAQVALVVTDVERSVDAEHCLALDVAELHLSPRLTRAAGIEHAAGIESDARRALAEIVRLAHDRSVLITAPGVDDPDQRDALREAGCDRAIGALFGAPEPASSID